MLASFWCDIVEAYTVKGAMNFNIYNSFVFEKKSMMGNSWQTGWKLRINKPRQLDHLLFMNVCCCVSCQLI